MMTAQETHSEPLPPNFQHLSKIATPAHLAVTASGGRWKMARHLALLNRRLIELVAGRTRRLMVFMPPRHGKSELCSRFFPAWFLGTFPDNRVILTAYESDFAAGFVSWPFSI